jgi:hypothetical protein
MVPKEIRRDGGPGYETKTVTVHEAPTEMGLMMTKFNGEEHPVLSDQGYRGDYVMFVVMTGPQTWSDSDPYKLAGKVDFELLTDLAKDIRHGVETYGERGILWEQVKDGERINRSDYEELKQDDRR